MQAFFLYDSLNLTTKFGTLNNVPPDFLRQSFFFPDACFASSSRARVYRRHEAEAARRTRVDAGAGVQVPRHAMPHVFEVRPPHRKNPLIERSSSGLFPELFSQA